MLNLPNNLESVCYFTNSCWLDINPIPDHTE